MVESYITNKIVSTTEEYILLCNYLKIQKRTKNALDKSKEICNFLYLGGMNKILPPEIQENIAFHLANKKCSKKKQATNWQNFCKQRKIAGFNYKENSKIWKSLDISIKTKYKNPYYIHF